MGDFPVLWNDWQWFLHYQWEMQTKMMREYIQTSESAFAREEDAFGDWIVEKAGTISEDDAERFGDECAAKIIALQDDFPALARQMAFCAMYAYFENQLIHVCDALKVFRKLSTNVREEKDRGILRAKTYLKNVAGISFPDNSPEWSKLLAYSRIRNVIMHNNSQVPRKELESFENDATLTGGILIDDVRRFSLTPDYVLAAIATVQKFFELLVAALPRETAQDRKEGLEKLMTALKKMGMPENPA